METLEERFDEELFGFSSGVTERGKVLILAFIKAEIARALDEVVPVQCFCKDFMCADTRNRQELLTKIQSIKDNL